MGYSYSIPAGRLCCDACGTEVGARKRTCPHKVHYADGGALPYCYPSALCAACYAKHKSTLHADCASGAAKRTAEEMARAAKLHAGDLEVKSAFGAWHASVPHGYTGVYFANTLTRSEAYYLVPVDDYRGGGFLSDYGDRSAWMPWSDPDAPTTKEVPYE